MATISNTPRPGYVWDSTDNVWYPIGVGGHSHPDYITQATAVNPTLIDAKGDIITATAADTPARLAVGNNGETLVADSSTSTGLRYQSNFSAGKNKVINGAFDNWQRGTSVTMTSGTYFLADRFSCYVDTVSGTTTYTQQAFTPGTAPVSGYEGTYFARVTTGGSLNLAAFTTKLEDVRVLAGQTVTVSFWMKSSVAKTFGLLVRQDFGTGGSGAVDYAPSYTTSTSWQRFTFTTTLGSLSGKTIGTNSCLIVQPIAYGNHSTSFTVDIWGVQIEASNTATAFQTATGTLQGELAACQRYYQALGGQSIGIFEAANSYDGLWSLLTAMRTTPSISYTGTITGYGVASGNNPVTAVSLKSGNTVNQLVIACTGPTGGAGTGTFTSGTGSILASAEL